MEETGERIYEGHQMRRELIPENLTNISIGYSLILKILLLLNGSIQF